ncbi:unnamed protein product [Ixodes hexagonus]
MILCSLKTELFVFLRELVVYLFIRVADLLFTLWFWRTPRAKLPEATDPLLLEPAIQLASKIRTGKLKSVDVLRAYVKRLEEVNPALNAVVDTRFQEALAEAEQVDRRVTEGAIASEREQPLLGVPFTVKNTIGVQGKRAAQCSDAPASSPYLAEDDDVQSLGKSGIVVAVVRGINDRRSLQCSVIAGVAGQCETFDARTKRAFLRPRGLAGGEASLLGAAASVVGLGTDLAGSIRHPAGNCGIFGHKPTHGIVSRHGLYPDRGEAVGKFSTPGPMCRYAPDLLPILRVMAGENAHKLALDIPVDLKKLKVFYLVDDGNKYIGRLQKKFSQAVVDAVACLEPLCESKPQPVRFEELPRASKIWMATVKSGAPPPFAEVIKNFTGQLNPLTELALKLVGRSHHTMSAIVVTLRERERDFTDPARVADLTAQGQRFVRKLEELLLDGDAVLVMPAAGFGAPGYHGQWLTNIDNVNYTCLFNTAMVPATACPLYLDKRGLPVGVQVVAARYKDRLCLAVARELASKFGGWRAPGTRSSS